MIIQGIEKFNKTQYFSKYIGTEETKLMKTILPSDAAEVVAVAVVTVVVAVFEETGALPVLGLEVPMIKIDIISIK